MKFFLLIIILLIYFPVLYYYKTKVIQAIGDAERPQHLRWYEGATYVIQHTSDQIKRDKLIKLRDQTRIAGLTGIILFWMVVLLYH